MISDQRSAVRKRIKKRSPDFTLYLITDRKLLSETGKAYSATRTLLPAVQKALKGGARAIQLREKDLSTRDLLTLAYKMRNLTKQYDAALFINDRIDVALAVGAEGVHLAQNSIPVEAVRKVVKKRLMIGVSTHTLKEAKKAEKGGADFITFGPVYRTPSKTAYGAPVGLHGLRDVCTKIKLPVFALGGIKESRIQSVHKTGVYGVAMISEILKDDDIKGKTERILSAL